MPIFSLANKHGIYRPEDLKFLKSVYDDILASGDHHASDNAKLAEKLLYLFKSGVADREQLYIAALK